MSTWLAATTGRYCCLCSTPLTGKQVRWCSWECKRTGNKREWRARYAREQAEQKRAAA